MRRARFVARAGARAAMQLSRETWIAAPVRGLKHQRGQAERVFLRQFAQAGLGCGAAAERAIEIGMAAEIHVPVRAQARHGQAIGHFPREQLAVLAQQLVVQRLQ
ncbi:hypothetical protein D3C87_1281580 [compost metagenome]